MKISRQLVVLAAVLYGLHVHVQSRALPATSLSPREHYSKVENITPLEARNLLFGRAPGFVAPKPAPKPGAHGVSSGDSSSSSSGSGEGDPSTGGGVRIGADDSGDSSGSDSSGSSGGVRLGADNSGESTSSGQSGNTQPNVRLGAGDTPPGGTPGNQQAGVPRIAGGSKPGDNGVVTIGQSKDVGELKTKGQQVDGQLQQVIKGNKDDKFTPDIDLHYTVNPPKEAAPLDPAKAMNKDIITPFEDLKIDLSEAKYYEFEVWSDVSGDKAISTGKYFAKDGVIVGQTRFAEADKNPAADKMISSDQVYQLWRKANLVQGNEAATLEATKKIKGFVGRDIQSLSTIETMQAMQKKVGAPLDTKTTFKRAAEPNDKPEVTAAKKEAFDTMLGTDFISSLNYMLKDHSKALGKKQITEITAYPRTYDPETKSGMEKITIGVKFEVVN